jgi:hypothetical protein
MRATPRPGPNGQTLKETAPPSDEGVAWERVASDTQEAEARADTSPNGERQKQSASRMRPSLLEFRARERRRLLIVLGVVAAVIVIVLVATLVIALRGDGDKTDPRTDSPPPNTLYVSLKGKDGAFRTVREAVRKSKPGYRIVVLDGPIEEDYLNLASSLGVPKDLTLETEPGATVEWKLKRSVEKPPTTLVTLSHLDGFTLRGFTFDGVGRVKDLLMITGACPGLTIEDVKLRNFERNGVYIANCQGTSERPVTIRTVQISVAKPVEAGFAFDINPSIKDMRANQHIKVSNVTMDVTTKFTKDLWYLVKPDVNDKTVTLVR